MNNNYQNPTNEIRFPVLIGVFLPLGTILWCLLASVASAETVRIVDEPLCPEIVFLPMIANEAETSEPSPTPTATPTVQPPSTRTNVNPIPIGVGDVISGSINKRGGCADYRFDAAAGEQIYFDVQQVDTPDLRWQMTGPTGTILFDDCLFCTNIIYDVAMTGSYTLTIHNAISGYQFQLWTVPEPQHFGISVGDTISADEPTVGAGQIESPVTADIYTFTASADQSLFLDMQSITSRSKSTETLAVTWRLHDPLGDTLFSDCLACGDKGPFTLTESGIYTLTVGGNATGSYGTYQFQLIDSSGPNSFAIAIGDVVSPDRPQPGAGSIEVSGAEDIYTFSATADQIVFFDMQTITNTGGIVWRVEDSLGATLFHDCLACGDPGAITLSTGGTYTITVGSQGIDDVGTYQFELSEVIDREQFAISIGDVVSNGVPDAGAGHIETPGTFDLYTIDAAPNEVVFFDMHSFDAGLNVQWQVKDSAGASLFRDCVACGDPGRKVLERGGTYTLTIGTATSSGTGTYQFQLWSVPVPERFDIAIGDVISQDTPGPGAGQIESPGAEDVYTFGAGAGQIVTFERQAFSPGLSTFWTLQDPNGDTIFRKSLGRGDQKDVELALGGAYTLTVGVSNNDSVGTYQFQITTQ